VDFDRDGFNDFAVLASGTQIDVFFGRPGMNTDYFAAGAGFGGDWPAQPPADADRGERITVGGATFIGIAAGDVNGDSNPDLVALDNTVGATGGVRVILGQGSTTVTPFVNANTAGQFRNYDFAVAGDLNNARVAVGNVASDSLNDIVVGAPNFDPDGAVATGIPGDGAIFVIHGSTGLAAAGTDLLVVAAAPTGRTVPGTLAAPAEQRGRQIHIGDFDGVAPLDVLAGHGNQIVAGIEIFVGAGTFPGAPTQTYNLAAAGDLVGGSLFFANVNGTAGTDILVGAAAANGGTGIFSVIPNGTATNTAINSALTADYVGGAAQALGSSLNVIDFDGDTNLDVIIGASGGGGGFWEVKDTPIAGDFTATGVDLRLNGPGTTAGDGVFLGDVNADGNVDIILTDTGSPRAFCLFGLD
jgi:hypothetical protein